MYGPATDTRRTLYGPSRSEFRELAREFNLVSVTRCVRADLETPVSAFMKLGNQENAFLLESAEGGERWGRYSLLGAGARRIVSSRDGVFKVEGMPAPSADGEKGDPVSRFFKMMEDFRPAPGPELPFSGGAVGFFGFDILPYLDRVELTSPSTLDLPDMLFMFTGSVLVFDHLLARINLVANVEIPAGAGEEQLDRLYDGAIAELERLAGLLRQPLPSRSEAEPYYLAPSGDFDAVSSDVTPEEFMSMVERAQEYILAGDAYQIVVSQAFSAPYRGRPFEVYRALRSINPAPYMFYLKCGDFCLVGSSPEPVVTRRGPRAMIRPIAGTRPRGATSAEDILLEEELRADPKERSEHVMLVDLARNDLGRVCLPGTVEVTRFMEVERYSHVLHLVSEVEGELIPGAGNGDLLRASFPAGTVSGAPKLRACEIIDELEAARRGPYAGAVGYIGYGGDMDTCIAIRMLVLRNGMAHVRAGAGIVAGSVPEREYEETRAKARALLRALRVAGGGVL